MYRTLLQSGNDPVWGASSGINSNSNATSDSPGMMTDTVEFTTAAVIFGVVALFLITLLFLVVACVSRQSALRSLAQHPIHLPPRELKIEDLCPIPAYHSPPVLIMQPDNSLTLAVIQEGDEGASSNDDEGGNGEEQQDDTGQGRQFEDIVSYMEEGREVPGAGRGVQPPSIVERSEGIEGQMVQGRR